MTTTLEVCVDCVDSAAAAVEAGADAVEVCAGLTDGGVTPSLALVAAVVRMTTTTTTRRRRKTKVRVLIRARPGDFCFSRTEIDVMRSDIRFLTTALPLDERPTGVVVGALLPDGTLNTDGMRALIAEAALANFEVTLHRAIDVSRNPVETLRCAAALGVHRVLSSGAAPTAWQGRATLRQLASVARETNIQLAAGGGIDETNAAALVAETTVAEIHGTFRSSAPARLRFNPPIPIFMGGEKINTLTSENAVRLTDGAKVARIADVLRSTPHSS